MPDVSNAALIAVREFLQSALAESDADERDPNGGSGWDVEVDARTVLRLLDGEALEAVTVPTKSEREELGEVLALVGDEDGCHQRVRDWEAQEEWEREAQPQEEPTVDREDAEYWNKHADAALAWVAGLRLPVPVEPECQDYPWLDPTTGVRFSKQNDLTLGYVYAPVEHVQVDPQPHETEKGEN